MPATFGFWWNPIIYAPDAFGEIQEFVRVTVNGISFEYASSPNLDRRPFDLVQNDGEVIPSIQLIHRGRIIAYDLLPEDARNWWDHINANNFPMLEQFHWERDHLRSIQASIQELAGALRNEVYRRYAHPEEIRQLGVTLQNLLGQSFDIQAKHLRDFLQVEAIVFRDRAIAADTAANAAADAADAAADAADAAADAAEAAADAADAAADAADATANAAAAVTDAVDAADAAADAVIDAAVAAIDATINAAEAAVDAADAANDAADAADAAAEAADAAAAAAAAAETPQIAVLA